MAGQQVIAKLQALADRFAKEIEPLAGEQELRQAQAKYLGKRGDVSQLMREMGKLSPEDRREVGTVFNRIKTTIVDSVSDKLKQIANQLRQKDLERTVDVTLPGRGVSAGHVHLLTQVQKQSVEIFAELGFCEVQGPQVETDFNSFEALAIPKDHPARDMQDTFYIGDDIVLRPHTSPVQIRVMQSQPPPVRIVAPGVVYRRDDDPTHSPMFTQIEGLWVDRGVRFSDLKGVLLHYVRRFFGQELQIRFRPSYFPFVEPGAEVDMQCSFCLGQDRTCRVCKGTGWVEIGGSGMVDPDVFAHVNYDSEQYSGFAFGMGLERMAMLRHGVNDIKYYYEGDLRFLNQF